MKPGCVAVPHTHPAAALPETSSPRRIVIARHGVGQPRADTVAVPRFITTRPPA
jgi:hypothetical protein